MIKKTIITFCLIANVMLLRGQSYFDGQSFLGVKAGMNVTNLTSSESDAKLGFLGGVTLDTSISDHFSFYPGLLFSFNRFNGVKNNYYTLQSFSLEVPILLSYKSGEYPTQLAFDFGPYVRYGLFGKTNVNNIKLNTFDYLKRFDLGGQVGARVLMNNFQIGFNFQYGFIKPCDLYKGNFYTFNLMLGYNFEL